MITVRKRRQGNGLALVLGLAGAAGFGLLIKQLLLNHNVALLNPKGMIAQQQTALIVFTVGFLLLAVIPTLFLFYFFAWKYREGNQKAAYDPGHRPKLLNLTVWGVPTAFMLALALVMWPATHQLAPQKAIAADAKTMTVQVVALRWKWLFIYPEQHIATVNYLKLPVNTPVAFEITADDMPMSSFWIPNLGGMLYSMTGHVNRLNLLPTVMGDYTGSAAEINGAGFADMKFTASVGSQADFERWTKQVKGSPETLDAAAYQGLLKPSQKVPQESFASVDPGLYDNVLMKYSDSMPGMQMEGMTQ